jgi:hypothetical protein
MDGAGQQYRDGQAMSSAAGECVQAAAERALRAKARALIQAGRVPDMLPTRRWGGPGIGAPCMVCGVAVEQQQVGIELELTPQHDGAAASQHFHVRCLAVLEHELRHRAVEGSKRSMPPMLEARSPGSMLPGETSEGA